MRVLVVGAGFSGLLAAKRLKERGFEVDVWEAASRPGGWVWTEPWPDPEGIPGALEWGPQELRFRSGDALGRLMDELGLRLRSHPSRDPRWVLRNGRREAQPRGWFDLIFGKGVSLGTCLRLGLEPLRPRHPVNDLESLVRSRWGPRALSELVEPLLASLVPAPPAQVGLEAIPGLATWKGSLVGFARAQAGSRSWVPEGGVGDLVHALASPLGSRLKVGCPVGELRRASTGWEVRGPEGTLIVDRVVLAVPPAVAGRLLEPVAPRAAARIRSIPCVDLVGWHSRHPGPTPWPRGFHMAVGFNEAPPILGVLASAACDVRVPPGVLQVRTYGIGVGLEPWSQVEGRLRAWIPELPPARQVTCRLASQAFPIPAPGHGKLCEEVDHALPNGLAWIGAGRFGPSLAALAEGLAEVWDPFPSP